MTMDVDSFGPRRVLRPSVKVLPEQARAHNRSLVLQTLYRSGPLSRADLARETALTRVTVGDLVAELIDERLALELGTRVDASRPGKPATLLDLNRDGHRIVGIDLGDTEVFRGALIDLDGMILERREVDARGLVGEDAAAAALALTRQLTALADRPVLGVGIGSPGIVDLAGCVLTAPNRGWSDLPLQARLQAELGLPVIVANDANAAALAEYGFGGASADLMLVMIGYGVGAGLLLDGTPLFGSRFAAGEIGHVVVGTDGGEACACGKHGCLETWLAVPRLRARLAAGEPREAVLRQAGERLGIALAPIVVALNLSEVVLSGPVELLDGSLAEATVDTLRQRTMEQFHGDLTVRLTTLGDDIVMRGAAVMVLSARLGVS
ncbi:ROK family transcriptional regulator [Microcella humidisoli]|uniref:ROK family transcriptional regulator n=1 Tax=Microcella humidisoli TaxID=2963406 RepID=A0ABY5FT70_9MICO|nr:ROK family transcriptional regulator [Microcella humidisoli]UTT61453.1 ROK family transcriptional regulator [Microcella humidisoli]